MRAFIREVRGGHGPTWFQGFSRSLREAFGASLQPSWLVATVDAAVWTSEQADDAAEAVDQPGVSTTTDMTLTVYNPQLAKAQLAKAKKLVDSSKSEPDKESSQPRRRGKAPLIARFILLGKLRFGTPKMSAANHAAVRRFISQLLNDKEYPVRLTDQVSIISAVTAGIFVPARDEVLVAEALDDPVVIARQARYNATRLGSLAV